MTSRNNVGQDGFGFSQFANALRERWWVIILSALVLGGVVFGGSLLIPSRYEATSKLAYQSPDTQFYGLTAPTSSFTPAAHNLQSDALVLRTAGFADQVSARLGLNITATELLSEVEVAAYPDLEMIEVKASGSTRTGAADVANAFSKEFLALRKQAAAQTLTSALDLVQERLKQLTTSQAATSYGLALQQQNDDLSTLLSLGVGDYRLLQEASIPTAASFPRPYLNMELGLILGALIGAGLAIMLTYMDRRIKDEDNLREELGVPVLAAIPRIRRSRYFPSSDKNLQLGFVEGRETTLESVRVLRSTLKLLGFGKDSKSLLVTSAVPQEGKSTVAINLALSMALSGDRVILVDGDLRNPSLHDYLNLSNDKGLNDVLNGAISWSEVAHPVDIRKYVAHGMSLSASRKGDVANAKILCITSGPHSTNSSELFESDVFGELLLQMQAVSDYVIIDSAPILVAPDASLLAQSVNAVILVMRLGKGTLEQMHDAKRLMEIADGKLLGVVVTGVKLRSGDQYYQYYHHRPL